ncbi:Delta(24(24(1)))-sterol reductase [Hortaea werneckii]|nr:Delta(24(24(1)))-sterol reductase [Hortaea werneckii]
MAGVPLSYCHCTIFIANHDPSEYAWSKPVLVFLYASYLFAYWVWDTGNSQKNMFRASERGYQQHRKTFPQLPWKEVKNPQKLTTESGDSILVDGWYKYARKIHYTCDLYFALCWGLITGFNSPFPWFYPVFFACMIVHRAYRDIQRCREKYGDVWVEYEKRCPYLFIPVSHTNSILQPCARSTTLTQRAPLELAEASSPNLRARIGHAMKSWQSRYPLRCLAICLYRCRNMQCHSAPQTSSALREMAKKNCHPFSLPYLTSPERIPARWELGGVPTRRIREHQVRRVAVPDSRALAEHVEVVAVQVDRVLGVEGIVLDGLDDPEGPAIQFVGESGSTRMSDPLMSHCTSRPSEVSTLKSVESLLTALENWSRGTVPSRRRMWWDRIAYIRANPVVTRFLVRVEDNVVALADPD